MKIHHLRNATFVIESGLNNILVDPMLSGKGQLPTFTHFRHTPERNPIVALPENALQILDKVTLCLITHSQKFGIELLTHTDHLDNPGKSFLKKNNIPVVCRKQDAAYMGKNGIYVESKLNYWQTEKLLGGEIITIRQDMVIAGCTILWQMVQGFSFNFRMSLRYTLVEILFLQMMLSGH